MDITWQDRLLYIYQCVTFNYFLFCLFVCLFLYMIVIIATLLFTVLSGLADLLKFKNNVLSFIVVKLIFDHFYKFKIVTLP